MSFASDVIETRLFDILTLETVDQKDDQSIYQSLNFLPIRITSVTLTSDKLNFTKCGYFGRPYPTAIANEVSNWKLVKTIVLAHS